MSDFIEDYLKGKAKLSDIDDYIDQWHESKTDLPVNEFLGMTIQEYELFVLDERNLENIVAAHKEKKNIGHVLHDEQEDYFKSKKK